MMRQNRVFYDTDDISVRLLASESILKDILNDEIVGSTATDLIDADQLAFRTFDKPTNTLIISDEAVTATVPANGTVAGPVTDDEFVLATREQYENAWDTVELFTLRTPPITRVSTVSAENDYSLELKCRILLAIAR